MTHCSLSRRSTTTAALLLLLSPTATAFQAIRGGCTVQRPLFVLSSPPPSWSSFLLSSSSSDQQEVTKEESTTTTTTTVEIPIESMRVKELQAALKELRIDYADCFDKESLVERLRDVLEGKIQAPPPKEKKVDIPSTKPASSTTTPQEQDTDTDNAVTNDALSSKKAESAIPHQKKKQPFDKDSKLVELRAMKVRELREECAKRRIRWAQFVEKEELVQALLASIEQSADFSVSGVMTPGEVTDLTGEQLEEELSQPSESPLLLDIYATWCGPCQMMAPQLKDAAVELGDRVRVGKIDSDKHPAMAQKLKANGLPTVLVLNGSEELERIEGAMMKNQILKFVEPYIN